MCSFSGRDRNPTHVRQLHTHVSMQRKRLVLIPNQPVTILCTHYHNTDSAGTSTLPKCSRVVGRTVTSCGNKCRSCCLPSTECKRSTTGPPLHSSPGNLTPRASLRRVQLTPSHQDSSGWRHLVRISSYRGCCASFVAALEFPWGKKVGV